MNSIIVIFALLLKNTISLSCELEVTLNLPEISCYKAEEMRYTPDMINWMRINASAIGRVIAKTYEVNESRTLIPGFRDLILHEENSMIYQCDNDFNEKKDGPSKCIDAVQFVVELKGPMNFASQQKVLTCKLEKSVGHFFSGSYMPLGECKLVVIVPCSMRKYELKWALKPCLVSKATSSLRIGIELNFHFDRETDRLIVNFQQE